jgi:tetratricopeptide (TPR) repeat protein
LNNIYCIIFLILCLASINETESGFASSHRGQPEADQIRAKGEASVEGTALWNKARVEYEQGERSRDARERSTHFRRAEEFAKQAIKADPQSDEGYKWLAIALGAQAEDVNVVTQVRLSRRVKENIEKALSIDPDDDISLLVLSRWHYKIASLEPFSKTFVKLVYGDLPEASLEKAESLLLRAIAKKDRIAHRYSLAKLYYRMGKREAALEQLRIALALPVTFASETEDIEKARRKLKSWK